MEAVSHLDVVYPKDYQDIFNADRRFKNQFPLTELNASASRQIRQQEKKYDWILNFHASPSSKRFVESIPSVQKLIHHHSRKGRNFGSDKRIVDLAKPMSAMERDLNVVRTLGWKASSPLPKVFVEEKSISWAEKCMSEVPRKQSNPRILFSPFASRGAKQWGLERYLRLAMLLHPNYEVVFNVQALELIPPYFLNRIKAFGYHVIETPKLWQLMGLLKQVHLVVGSDSGTKHLAVATGTKTLTLFGPESVGEWHGYDVGSHPYLQVPVSCRDQDKDNLGFEWCGVSNCPYSSHQCMLSITPEDVALQVRNLLNP